MLEQAQGELAGMQSPNSKNTESRLQLILAIHSFIWMVIFVAAHTWYNSHNAREFVMTFIIGFYNAYGDQSGDSYYFDFVGL